MGKHGGARAGAGRKPKAVEYARPIKKAEKQIIDVLPEVVEKQIELARGGIEVVQEEWVPAGTVQIDGEVVNPEGKSVRIKQLAFPGLPPEQLVLVKKVVKVLPPSEGAGQYLQDRIMGKPTQHEEITGADGEPLFELSDTERTRRLAALLERARARRAGPAPGHDGSAAVDPVPGSAD